MDVTALYPSIQSQRAGFIVKKAVEETTMVFTNVNWEMATRYIAKSAKTQEEVQQWGMDEFCPKRSKNRGYRPGMTGAAQVDRRKNPHHHSREKEGNGQSA